MKHSNQLTCLCFLILLSACNPTKNLPGTYRSNFATAGFFVTWINLKADSTFTYRMSGDVMADAATGKYQVKDRFLVLQYDPPKIDTI